jgi:broad specificity phosphatase PhoE
MPANDEIVQPHVGTVEHSGRRYNVSVRIEWDGIEYVGRLWFADEAWDDLGIPDRGAFPGRTRDEVIAQTKRLTEPDLSNRYKRALAEKRRYTALRRRTEDVLAKIRYLNQVAVSMRAGMLDVDGAAQEIDLTEQQLHALIDKLGEHAGVET